MHPLDNRDLFLGLTGLAVGDTEPIDLGSGLSLSSASSKFLSPLTLVCPQEQSPDLNNPKPAFIQFPTGESEVTAQLHIPVTAAPNFLKRFELGRFVVSLLRLWSDPGIGLHALSTHNFESLLSLPESDRPSLIPIETNPRHFSLRILDPLSVIGSLSWVQENWKAAYVLYESSSEFRLAADTLDSSQFVPNPALTLVALWGALEAIFSPSTSELRFRVSSLIASYLEPAGEKRLQMQKQIASLYDMRSAAAHGKPRHQSDDLLKSHELLRKVVIRMIHAKTVPTKELLESKLFGAV